MRSIWTFIIASITLLSGICSQGAWADDAANPCVAWVPLPLDLSVYDPTRYTRFLEMTRPSATDPATTPRISVPQAGSSDGRPQPPLHTPDQLGNLQSYAGADSQGLTYTDANGKQVPVVVSSSSVTNQALLETTGQVSVSIKNVAELSGSAELSTGEISAKGTADIHVFHLPLSDGVSLFGFSRTQIYLTRDGGYTNGSWSSEALSTGAGLGLELPGPTDKHPTEFTIGGGPMLLWDPQEIESKTPILSGTVMADFQILLF